MRRYVPASYMIDAATDIPADDRLCDYVKAAEVPCWIPVSERMPDIDTLVIACVAGRYVTPLRRHKQAGFWQHDDGDVDELTVTHWMEFPQPPEISDG